MVSILVSLQCVTNLHVGNGDVNYNIIDNEVERDPVTNYPTIHSSGIKGSFREYFSSLSNLKESKINNDLVNRVFGSDEAKNTTQGCLKFLSADMLAMPARASAGHEAYYMITTKTALERFQQLQKEFLGKAEPPSLTAIEKDVAVEGYKPEGKVTINSLGSFYVISDEDFRRISLPVLARNRLNNGISQNLWYEEVVPHESIFVFPVLADEKDTDCLNQFSEIINGKVVQFGGNASIGYGLCKVSVMEEKQ